MAAVCYQPGSQNLDHQPFRGGGELLWVDLGSGHAGRGERGASETWTGSGWDGFAAILAIRGIIWLVNSSTKPSNRVKRPDKSWTAAASPLSAA
jgi:hypothetical protein